MKDTAYWQKRMRDQHRRAMRALRKKHTLDDFKKLAERVKQENLNTLHSLIEPGKNRG